MEFLPAVFISHGSPMEAVEWGNYQKNLRSLTNEIEQPKAIVSVSAHWQYHQPIQITGNSVQSTIHDFYGFPEELYHIRYDAPGDPKLAASISKRLNMAGIMSNLTTEWGLDHGTWVPLKIMFPKADIPVLQISIPIPRSPSDLYKIGSILKDLRREGVMLLGSGGVTHNLRLAMINIANGREKAKPDIWAYEFDAWVKENLEERKFENILSAQKHPFFPMAAPTTEHFDPIHFILGSLEPDEGVRQIHEEIKYGNLSMRTFISEA